METRQAEPVTVSQFIGGEWVVGSGAEVVRVNPARPSEAVTRLRRATSAEVDDSAACARTAWPEWRAKPLHERAGILSHAAELLDQRAQVFGTELTREEGKTLREGVGEVRRAARIFRYFASEAEREVGELYASPRAGESVLTARRPLGVVAVITPWNFPIAIPAWKIAPALMYGNTVVWKPAELVPLLASRLVQILLEAGLPAGVLNLVIGPGSSVGDGLVQDSRVDAVTFTGSTSVGRWVIDQCGRAAKPVQAEMGGKNVAVVLADANLTEAADQIVKGAMESTGQKCTATSRLVVQEQVADRLLAEISSRVQSWRVGDGLDPAVDMGPAVSAEAQSDILAAVDGALATGARLLAGGPSGLVAVPERAFFVPPTVLEVHSEDSDIWQHEVFGPVLAVKRAVSWRDCVELANSTPYGLTASIFTNDFSTVMDSLAQLDVGILHVNSETTGAEPHVPFGGLKASGYGPREQGRAAREFFTKTQTVYLRAATVSR